MTQQEVREELEWKSFGADGTLESEARASDGEREMRASTTLHGHYQLRGLFQGCEEATRAL